MGQAGPVNDAGDLLPGEFGAATRLSPKALRVYAEQGLLAPAMVDPVTGYRRYRRDQVPRGRLIARLRALDLPLVRIATLLELDPTARQAELRAWLSAQESRLRRQRELVEALDAVDGRVTATPRLRPRPERKLLSQERRGHIGDLEAVITEAEGRVRARLRAAGVPDDGPTLVHFHGFVTRDSDGPVEVAVPFTGPVEPVDDLRVRLSPAGTDAYLPVAESEDGFPAILRAYETLDAWIDVNRLICVASPVEIRPGTAGALFDITYPIAPGKDADA